MAESEAGDRVQLYVYDLSQGFAALVSQALLGKHIAGVWHTAIVVRGYEYFFGGGVQKCPAGSTPYGHPVDVVNLGETQIPQEVFDEYIADLSQVFTAENYDLFRNNCNTFSNEVSTFLTGHAIPEHITALPTEVLSTPLGQMIAPSLAGVESQLGSVQQGDAPVELSAVTGSILPALEASSSADAASARSAAPPAASAASAGQGRVAVQSLPSASSEGHEQQNPEPAMPSAEAAPEAIPVSKAAFEAAVRAEFARMMAAGGVSANEAAVLAVAHAKQTYSQAGT